MDIAANLIGSIDETKAFFAWDGSTSGSCLRKAGTSNQRFEPRIWPVVCPFIAPTTAGAFPSRECALFPEKVSGRERGVPLPSARWPGGGIYLCGNLKRKCWYRKTRKAAFEQLQAAPHERGQGTLITGVLATWNIRSKIGS